MTPARSPQEVLDVARGRSRRALIAALAALGLVLVAMVVIGADDEPNCSPYVAGCAGPVRLPVIP